MAGVPGAAAGENLTPLPRPMGGRMVSLGLAVGGLPLKEKQSMLTDNAKRRKQDEETWLTGINLPAGGNVNSRHVFFIGDHGCRLLLLLLRLLRGVGGGLAFLGLLWLMPVRSQVFFRQLGKLQ